MEGMEWWVFIRGTRQPRKKKENINIAEARGFEVSLSQYFDSKTKFKLLILYLGLLVIFILFLPSGFQSSSIHSL
jgi:hypothetical protein